jgi:hypothetical protein
MYWIYPETPLLAKSNIFQGQLSSSFDKRNSALPRNYLITEMACEQVAYGSNFLIGKIRSKVGGIGRTIVFTLLTKPAV